MHLTSDHVQLPHLLPVGLQALSVNQNSDTPNYSSIQQLFFDSESSFEMDSHSCLPLCPSSRTPQFETTSQVAHMDTVSPISDADLSLLEQSFGSVGSLALLSPRLEMMWSNWPAGLPPPKLLRHLCVSSTDLILTSNLFTYILLSALRCSSLANCTLVASSMYLPS